MLNIKFALTLLLCSAMLLCPAVTVNAASDGSNLSARAAVLYEPTTKAFLITKNEGQRLPMASTTKIMTALVAIENSTLNDTVTVDERSVGIEGSSAYLTLGAQYTMEEMLYALLLQSANDAAIAIACAVAGDVYSFVGMMNQKCSELGLSDTHFDNPNGLDGQTHYTTARDLALISAAAMQNEIFKTIASTYKKQVGEDSDARLFVNHNKLLRSYDGCNGIKTGFTKKSGRCLVSSATRAGLTLIGVTLDAPNDWNDHKRMFDYGFDTLECRTLASKGEFSYDIPLLSADNPLLRVENTEEITAVLPKGASDVKSDVILSRFACAPIKEGDILGSVVFTHEGKQIGRVNLVATENVAAKKEKTTLFDYIKNKFKRDL